MNCCLGIGRSSRTWCPAQREDQKDVRFSGWLPYGYRCVTALLRRARRKTGTLQDFVGHIAANPGRVNFASVGVGSFYHLLIEQMMVHGKLSMTYVPYRGGAAIRAPLFAR
jgi:hypothetical protein